MIEICWKNKYWWGLWCAVSFLCIFSALLGQMHCVLTICCVSPSKNKTGFIFIFLQTMIHFVGKSWIIYFCWRNSCNTKASRVSHICEEILHEILKCVLNIFFPHETWTFLMLICAWTNLFTHETNKMLKNPFTISWDN